MTQPDDYIQALLMLYREMIQRNEALALEVGWLRERTERQAERIKDLEAELASRSKLLDAPAKASKHPWWQICKW